MRGAWFLAVATVLLFDESSAFASPVFPGAIQQHLGLTYSPPCSLCHAGGVTGLGTVTTPFGNAMRVRGLVARDIASLDTALDRMASDQVDSNGNGVSDIDELKAGTDPNAGVPGAVSPPEFGCRAARGHGELPPWSAAWLAAAAALIVRRGARRAPRVVRQVLQTVRGRHDDAVALLGADRAAGMFGACAGELAQRLRGGDPAVAPSSPGGAVRLSRSRRTAGSLEKIEVRPAMLDLVPRSEHRRRNGCMDSTR